MDKRQAVAAGGLAAALLLGAGGTAMAAGPNRGPGPHDYPPAASPMRHGGGGNGGGCVTAPTASLSASQRATLLHMREEEQLAHDLYVAFAEQWGTDVFGRIAASESRHVAAVQRLLDRYQLADPSPGAGFADEGLQAMWDKLLDEGLSSREAALEVGRTIERADIADLQRAIAAGQPTDVARVYQRLLQASRHHLAAFGG